MWQRTRGGAAVDFGGGDDEQEDQWRSLQDTLLDGDDAPPRDTATLAGDLSFPVLPSSSNSSTSKRRSGAAATRKERTAAARSARTNTTPAAATSAKPQQTTLTRAFSEKEMERLFTRYDADDGDGSTALAQHDDDAHVDVTRFLQHGDDDDDDVAAMTTSTDAAATPRADEFLALLTRPATTTTTTTATRQVAVAAVPRAPAVASQDEHAARSAPPATACGYRADATPADTAQTAVQLAPLSCDSDTTPTSSNVSNSDDTTCRYVYWLDAKEQPYGMSVDPGSVFVFGKLLVPGGGYESCCVRVRNVSRCVYLLPAAGASEADVVGEINELCRRHGIEERRVKFVQRYYAFEQPRVPRERAVWAKLRYPARYPPLALSPRHRLRHIATVLGATTSLLELLLLKRRLKGPSFLQLDAAAPAQPRISHCAHELVVDSPKRVRVLDEAAAARLPPPVLTLASVQLHAQLDSLGMTNEVHIAAIGVYHKVNVDATLPTRPHTLLVGVRPFAADVPLPLDLESACASSGLGAVRRCTSEQALLEWLAEQLGAIDADVYVGHNFAAFTLATLLTRYQELSVRRWSTLGRLDLKRMPRLQQGGGGGGSGGGGYERDVCAGRLIVDTYTLAREYYKSVNYKLLALAQQMQLTGLLLQQSPHATTSSGGSETGATLLSRNTFATARGVVTVLAHVCNSTVLACGVAAHLDVLRLTKRLSSIAGNLWSRTLCGARSERIEYLLLHAFHDLKFITPDKHSYHTYNQHSSSSIDSIGSKRSRGGGGDEVDDHGDGDTTVAADGGGAAAAAAGTTAGTTAYGEDGRRKAKYQGGIVLEPKCGLYTDYVLLLDFNSLYPSLIQEFNICFTTVDRHHHEQRQQQQQPYEHDSHKGSIDGGDAEAVAVPAPEQLICGVCAAAGLPSPCLHRCILPKVIKSLVDSRREVKRLMRGERDATTLALLEIRQKALKLTANSMYGCLGFEHSRFYAPQLAELVTRQGRHVLQSTVELVPQINPTLRVLYGDTDSVMIQTGIKDNIAAVRELGQELKAKINKRYRSLEIDIDGVFRAILLLKKKKYAALSVVDWQAGGTHYAREVKGLDMVRRDWCPLSKQVSDDVLNRVLGADGGEDVLDFIMRYMRDVADKVRRGDCYTLDQFVISKSLTKEPEAYHGSAFAHAAVALRMKQRKELVRVGDLIPYVMCVGDKLADKAYHVDEVRHDATRRLDAEWYIAAQLYPPVLRLCEHIQGFSSAQLSDAMGIASGGGGSHNKQHGGGGGASRAKHGDDGDDDGDDDDNDGGGRRAVAARDFGHCAMFANRDPADCFPAALQLQVTCPHCQLVTPVDPHQRVRSVMAARAGTHGDETAYDLYVCGSCTRSLPVDYVANCLTQVCYTTMRRFYECGGGAAAARAVREQMTFFRALYDVPHAPGCAARVKHHHRALARRCLGTDGRLYTLDEADDAAVAEACEPVDAVRAAAETFYKRVEHMFVSLDALFASAPSAARGGAYA